VGGQGEGIHGDKNLTTFFGKTNICRPFLGERPTWRPFFITFSNCQPRSVQIFQRRGGQKWAGQGSALNLCPAFHCFLIFQGANAPLAHAYEVFSGTFASFDKNESLNSCDKS
jgi:hypothetical protein